MTVSEGIYPFLDPQPKRKQMEKKDEKTSLPSGCSVLNEPHTGPNSAGVQRRLNDGV